MRESTDSAPLIICGLDELEDPGSRAFSIGAGDWPVRGFVVRAGDEIFAYLNRCPHAGHPLNMLPHRFLTADSSLILCNSHGALFEITTGACVAGPCAGRGLRKISVRVIDGRVMLDEDLEALLRLTNG